METCVFHSREPLHCVLHIGGYLELFFSNFKFPLLWSIYPPKIITNCDAIPRERGKIIQPYGWQLVSFTPLPPLPPPPMRPRKRKINRKIPARGRVTTSSASDILERPRLLTPKTTNKVGADDKDRRSNGARRQPDTSSKSSQIGLPSSSSTPPTTTTSTLIDSQTPKKKTDGHISLHVPG